MRIVFIQELIDLLRHKVWTLQELVNKKLGYKLKNQKDIHTLILGSSHLACGYRAQSGEFNFSSPSQDLYYNYHLNLKGAEKLTELIRKNINNKEKICQESVL